MKNAFAQKQNCGEKIPIRILLRDRQGNIENHTIHAEYGDNLLDTISRNFDITVKSNELGAWITSIHGKDVRISEDMQGGIQGYVNNTLPYIVASANPFFVGFQNIAVTSEFELRMQYDPYLQDIEVPLSMRVKALAIELFEFTSKNDNMGECASCSAPFDESMRKNLGNMVGSDQIYGYTVESPVKEGLAFASICCDALPESRIERPRIDASHLIQHELALEIALEKATGRIEITEQPNYVFPYNAAAPEQADYAKTQWQSEQYPTQSSTGLDSSLSNASYTKDTIVTTPEYAPVELAPSTSTTHLYEGNSSNQEENSTMEAMRSFHDTTQANISKAETASFTIPAETIAVREDTTEAYQTRNDILKEDRALAINFRMLEPAGNIQQKMELMSEARYNIGTVSTGLRKVGKSILGMASNGNAKSSKQKEMRERPIRNRAIEEIAKKIAAFAMPNGNKEANAKMQGRRRTNRKGNDGAELIFAFDKAGKVRLKRVARNSGIWRTIGASVKRMLRLS